MIETDELEEFGMQARTAYDANGTGNLSARFIMKRQSQSLAKLPVRCRSNQAGIGEERINRCAMNTSGISTNIEFVEMPFNNRGHRLVAFLREFGIDERG